MVVAQRLIRRVCPKCAETYTSTLKELQDLKVSEPELEALREQGARGLDIKRAAALGCRDCFGRGYKGRTGIHEVLIVSDEMRQAILDRAPMRELARMARDTGMTSLREDGWAKVKNGITTLEELNTEVKWGT
jgi:type IV pilus assembly protein PilB